MKKLNLIKKIKITAEGCNKLLILQMEGVVKRAKMAQAEDVDTAIKLLGEAGEDGEALCLLGSIYTDTVKCDFQKAMMYFKKSAETGHPRGMLEYGWRTGKESWLKKAFETDDYFVKGYCYRHGHYIEKDLEESFKWFLKSGKDRDKEGECYVGMGFYFGDGVQSDIKKSYKWFLKSANQGDAYSQHMVATALYVGIEIERNYTLSWKWFKKSAQYGYKPSIIKLGWRKFENFGLHENCRNLLLHLICIKKYKKNLIIFPLDIVMLIAKLLWNTRNESIWEK
jgi:uncharacterized protein